ncbi:GNAT family N-acetyltransferase [Alienimonas sp. DA493]|uniref:GNAT family N-acetyltransferase n=1 Tax=Alienimonas sp. DA493 TaxID=3373605 RepID=UPI0037544382
MRIVPWAEEFRPAFEALNREWLEVLFAVEPADEAYFADPVGTILEPGGAIWFAVDRDVAADRDVAVDREVAVGTVALIRQPDATFELAKMGVTAAWRGRGVGRALVETALAHAAAEGAGRVTLLSNTKLTAALRLYERLGFRRVPCPPATGYSRCDVAMELALDGVRSVE